jgi:pilus assembly protein Flp/PilA
LQRHGACREKPCDAISAGQTGATSIEYGLIAAGISVAIIAVVSGLATKLKTTFTSVQTALK